MFTTAKSKRLTTNIQGRDDQKIYSEPSKEDEYSISHVTMGSLKRSLCSILVTSGIMLNSRCVDQADHLYPGIHLCRLHFV